MQPAKGVTSLLLSGCVERASNESMSEMQGMDQSQTKSSTKSNTMEGMNHGTMAGSSSQPFDAQFIDSMIVHHQGAVEMANEVLQKAEHPELKTFAEAIITAQTKEIGDMQDWRKTWYPTLPATSGMGMSMGEMSIGSDQSIPFDQRFLTAMIAHHQGAIDMANKAVQMKPEHNEIKTLSDAIIQAQKAEIEQMKAWLKEWYNQ